MVQDIKFRISAVQEAEEYYKRLHMTAEQKKQVDSISKVLSHHVSIPERAIKGFFWRVLREYQIRRHMGLDESKNLSIDERIEGLKEIFSLLREDLTRILVDPEQSPLLDKAFEQSLNLIKEQLTK